MSTLSTILGYIQSSMPELNSSSKASITYKLAEAIAVIVDNTLTEFDNTEAIITDIIGNQRYGRAGYFIEKAKAFQYGDNLTVNDPPYLDPVYEAIDTTKQIIIQASYQVTDNQGIMKVATEDDDENLIALDSDQLLAFKNYIAQFEMPGLPIEIVSIDANVLAYTAVITYSKTFDLATLQSNLQTYEASFRSTYEFNGTLYVNSLIKYLMSNVPGLVNIDITDTTLDGDEFSGETALTAGYFNYGTLTKSYVGI